MSLSHLLECLGTGQKITNAVNPSINLLFPVPLNWEDKTVDCDTGSDSFQRTTITFKCPSSDLPAL